MDWNLQYAWQKM